jgi:WD40 repeat protein
LAFTPTEDKLVVFSKGEAKFHKLPSGERWQQEVVQTFPFDKKGDGTSDLIQDAKGELFVFVYDWRNSKSSIHDLLHGTEIRALHKRHIWYGGIGILHDHEGLKTQLREIPSTNILAEFVQPDRSNGFGEIAFTPDGRTVVYVDGKVRMWRDGAETTLDLDAHQEPALSSDGHFLAARVFRSYPTWLKPFVRRMGFTEHPRAVAVYDLGIGKEVGYMPEGQRGQFSPDGKTLAVATEDGVELHDLPLRKPRSRIAGVAIVFASSTFGVIQCVRWRRRKRAASIRG